MFMWTRTILTIPRTGPVLTVADVKSHLAIAHDEDDAYLATLIEVATGYIDGPHGIGVALSDQTYRTSLDGLPRTVLIPHHPVTEIVSIIVDGSSIDAATYDLDSDCSPAVLRTTGARGKTKTKITFKAGYADGACPADLLHAIRLIVGHLYANREAATVSALHDLPFGVQSILARHRVG